MSELTFSPDLFFPGGLAGIPRKVPEKSRPELVVRDGWHFSFKYLKFKAFLLDGRLITLHPRSYGG
jgi:hypothetical protein